MPYSSFDVSIAKHNIKSKHLLADMPKYCASLLLNNQKILLILKVLHETINGYKNVTSSNRIIQIQSLFIMKQIYSSKKGLSEFG